MSKPQSEESTSQPKPSTHQRMQEAQSPQAEAQIKQDQLQCADSSEGNSIGVAKDFHDGTPSKSLVKVSGDDQHFVRNELSNEDQYGTMEGHNKKAGSEDRSS